MKYVSASLFIIILTSSFLFAQVPDFEWATIPGGPGNVSYPNIAADGSGNVIISANFRGSISLGETTLTNNTNQGDICLVKYNSSGEVLWARKEGGENHDIVYGAAADQNGNIFITGIFENSTTFGNITIDGDGFFLAKFDPSGTIIWVRHTTGSGGATGKHVKTDAFGNAYVTGGFGGTPTFGDETLLDYGGVFIAKYNSSGDVIWIKQSYGSGYGQAYGLDVDDAGNSAITGWFEDTLVWGATTMISTVGTDMFIAKYNSAGDRQWAKQIGISDWAGGYGSAFDNVGNVYFTGDFDNTASFGDTTLSAIGSSDSFVAKYSTTGELIWVRSVGGINADHTLVRIQIHTIV